MGRLGGIAIIANEFIPFFINPYELSLFGVYYLLERPALAAMADSQIGVGQDGMFVTVRTHGGEPVCARHIERAVNFQPAFARASQIIDDPQWYEKPERLIGRGQGIPADEDGGPGYLLHHRVEFTPEGFRVHSTRPYHPLLSLAGRQNLAGYVGEWISGGVLPNV